MDTGGIVSKSWSGNGKNVRFHLRNVFQMYFHRSAVQSISFLINRKYISDKGAVGVSGFFDYTGSIGVSVSP